MAKRKKDWPPWWDWDLKLIPHMKARLAKRQFTEIELRRMMEYATNFRPDVREGRWVIETRFRGRRWEVIVEPTPEEERLEVVTAYEVWE